jgi:Flp pilus assembly protein TadD
MSVRVSRDVCQATIGFLLCSLLTACSGTLPDGLARDHKVEPEIFGSLPAERPLALGKRYYREGQFGLAEQAFRNAIELNKSDTEAWLGLAASYDRLRRFDQARRAYDVLIKLVGATPVVLNNLGYHYMLQGEYAKARKTILAAQRSDPGNEFVRNNIDLIETGDLPDDAASSRGG